jgi:hypothetical protein
VAAQKERERLAAENTRLRHALVREGRLMFLGAVAILLISGGIGTFVFFRHLAFADLVAARQLISQVQSDDENQRNLVSAQNVKISKLDIELGKVKADLESIRPEKGKFNIPPNESRIAADGLIIGLVGSPSNESVVLSINDKQQTLVAGQRVVVSPNPSTTCQVTVQSFTMVQAVVTATCAATKPQ